MDSANLLKTLDGICRVKQVIVDGKEFLIHCYRFAAKSDYFNALLMHDFAEKKMKCITIQGIERSVFNNIYRIFNDGTIHLTYEDAIPLYIACRYLLVKDVYLKDLQAFILHNLDHLDVLELYEYCVIHNDLLLDAVKGHLAARIESVYNTEPFNMISLEAMMALVTDSRIKITEEDSLCWAIAGWLSFLPDRKIHTGEILSKMSPGKFIPDYVLNFTDDKWNTTFIADVLYWFIFEYNRKIARPIKSEFFKEDEPLYISNENGILTLTHFEGSQWSVLDAPRTPLDPSIMISAAARNRSELFVATWEFCLEDKEQTNVLLYNFRTRKMIEMRKPLDDRVKGLHLISHKLFLNTRHMIQQYCAEYNIWLNPIDIGFGEYHFSTTDGQCLYSGGYYEESGRNSVHFYDPRMSEWVYWVDMPGDYQATCASFINDDLYVVALGRNINKWNIFKLDNRNCQWENIIYYWSRSSATPVSIKRCKDQLVVMDHHQNTLVGSLGGGNGRLRLYDYYNYYLKPVHSVD